jgi:hypothetical protein
VSAEPEANATGIDRLTPVGTDATDQKRRKSGTANECRHSWATRRRIGLQ